MTVLILVAVVTASFNAEGVWRARQDALRGAINASRNLSEMTSTEISHTLLTLEASLTAASSTITTDSFATLGPDLQEQALALSFADQRFDALITAGPSGNVWFRRGADTQGVSNVSDQDYFTRLRDGLPDQTLISAPFRPTRGGTLAIAVGRRMQRPNGQFDGVMVGLLDLSYFHELFDKASLGQDGTMALFLHDTVIVARTPWNDAVIGKDISGSTASLQMMNADSGSFEAFSPLDGVTRISTFVHAKPFPFTVTVNVSTDTVYQQWRSGAWQTGLTSLLITLTLLGVAFLLDHELRHRARAEASARESAAWFRLIEENMSDVIIRFSMDGRRTYISPSVFRKLGYTAEELTDPHFDATVVHPDDEPLRRDAARRLAAGEDEVPLAYRCIHRNGTEVYVEARLRLIRDERTGDARGIVSIARDATLQHGIEAELLRLAATDGLTGIANRRAFDEALERDWGRAMRIRGQVCLLMIDADNFKAFNDRYGHLEGDGVLKAIAGVIAGAIGRSSDVGARYGGEEFAVLLPGSDLDGALEIAERIRRAIEAKAIPHELSVVGWVTVSIGVACVVPELDSKPNRIIEEADVALYAAKHLGRNRIAVAHQFADMLAIGGPRPAAAKLPTDVQHAIGREAAN